MMIDNQTIEIVQMLDTELKPFREDLAHAQGLICPICDKERELQHFVVDHQHKTKGEKNGHRGAGMIRGVICFMCNSTEGRMLAKFKRSGLNKDVNFGDYLRALADYLDTPTTHFIHPTEKVKVPKLMKRPFNKIKKIHDEQFPKRKKLEYPKSGKASKLIKELAEEYNISL